MVSLETVKKLSSELEASPTSLTGSAGGNFHRGVGRVLVFGGQGPPAVQFCSVSDTLLKLRDPETVFHSLPTELVSQCSPQGAGWLAGGMGSLTASVRSLAEKVSLPVKMPCSGQRRIARELQHPCTPASARFQRT